MGEGQVLEARNGGRRGFRFRRGTRGWKVGARADCSRCEENNANNGRGGGGEGEAGCGETRLTRWIQLHYELDYHLNGNKREMLKYTGASPSRHPSPADLSRRAKMWKRRALLSSARSSVCKWRARNRLAFRGPGEIFCVEEDFGWREGEDLFFLHASLFDARFDLLFRVLEKGFWIRSIFFFFFFGKIALR